MKPWERHIIALHPRAPLLLWLSFAPNDRCPGLSFCASPPSTLYGFCFLITPASTLWLLWSLSALWPSSSNCQLSLQFETFNLNYWEKLSHWFYLSFCTRTHLIYYLHHGLLTTVSEVSFWCNQLDCGWREERSLVFIGFLFSRSWERQFTWNEAYLGKCHDWHLKHRYWNSE